MSEAVVHGPVVRDAVAGAQERRGVTEAHTGGCDDIQTSLAVARGDIPDQQVGSSFVRVPLTWKAITEGESNFDFGKNLYSLFTIGSTEAEIINSCIEPYIYGYVNTGSTYISSDCLLLFIIKWSRERYNLGART